MVGGLAVYVVSAYAAYIYFSWKNIPDSPPPAPAARAETQKNVSHVYDRIAKDYDSMIGWSEFWMGMPLLRKALSRRLEVCFVAPAAVLCIYIYRPVQGHKRHQSEIKKKGIFFEEKERKNKLKGPMTYSK